MDGPSRASWLGVVEALHETQKDGQLDLRGLAGELFSVAEALAAQSKLRRALSDSSRDAAPKRDLARRLLAGKLSPTALAVVESAVGQRWTSDRDLVDAMERLGIDTVLAAAERDGNLDRVESELFRFDRAVVADAGLRTALRDPDAPKEKKSELVTRLLAGKALPDTVWLAQRPVLNPRGRRYSAAIWRQLNLAARRREQITAIVTTAIPLDDGQRERMKAALGRVYGRAVNVQTVIDPSVVGGVHVRVGDEVIDGTIARRLEDSRAHMGLSKKA